MKVKIRWWQARGIREKVCVLSESNSTVHFAESRGLDRGKLKVSDFERQRFVYFVDGAGHFMIRYEDLIDMEYVE